MWDKVELLHMLGESLGDKLETDSLHKFVYISPLL
jgi:hypothetical protein